MDCGVGVDTGAYLEADTGGDEGVFEECGSEFIRAGAEAVDFTGGDYSGVD